MPFGKVLTKLNAPTHQSGAASPSSREMARITQVRMPGNVLGVAIAVTGFDLELPCA